MDEDIARSVGKYYKAVSEGFGLSVKIKEELTGILEILVKRQEVIAEALDSIDEASELVAAFKKASSAKPHMPTEGEMLVAEFEALHKKTRADVEELRDLYQKYTLKCKELVTNCKKTLSRYQDMVNEYHMTKPEHKKMIVFYNGLISECRKLAAEYQKKSDEYEDRWPAITSNMAPGRTGWLSDAARASHPKWGARQLEGLEPPGDGTVLDWLTNVDRMIAQQGPLLTMTSCTPEQFDYLCQMCWERIVESGKGRLFPGEWGGEPSSRNSGWGLVRHALFFALACKTSGLRKDMLGDLLGMPDGAADQYLSVLDSILAEILPTTKNLVAAILLIYEKYLKAKGAHTAEPTAQFLLMPPSMIGGLAAADIVPYILPERDSGSAEAGRGRAQIISDNAQITINTDGEVDQKDWERLGKGKPPVYTIIVIVCHSRLILWVGDRVWGRPNPRPLLVDAMQYMESLVEARAGRAGAALSRSARQDAGWGRKEGAPPHRAGPGDGPSRQDYNHGIRITPDRIAIEQVIGRIKKFEVLRRPRHETAEAFGADLNIITGLVNMKALWGTIRAKNESLILELTAWRRR